jgi:Tfp pilus assembly protein PilF
MNWKYQRIQRVLLASVFAWFAVVAEKAFAQPVGTPPATNEIRIVEQQGTVEMLPARATTWAAARPGQVLHPLDRIRTAENSRVALRWSDQSIVPFGASTELEILPPEAADAQAGLHLVRGVISFFHRDQPGRIRIITRGAVAGVEGTEFVLAVDAADRTTLSVVDGKVKLGNAQATLLLTNGEQAAVDLGRAPVRTAGFIANNLLQWCFYYPAVIDPDELPLTAEEQNNLAGSLASYRAGDLQTALEKYPAGRPNLSDGELVYHAALLLAVGEVEKAETAVSAVTSISGRPVQLTGALRQLIAAVKRQPPATDGKPQLASEFLAASYFEQSRAVRETSLQSALRLAKQAAAVSPKFGFAWERVAELEFSFGRPQEALAALDQSLALAPRNAQALALKGFVLAAQNQPRAARAWFDLALNADAALGNAWLGRGLIRIRLGDQTGGREDLLVAAALEPQRAELRSYLGKAYAHVGDFFHATKELVLAKKLDPNDPTAWLYSALLNQQNNQINAAIRDLEKSQALNDNRSVYRSQLLLDEDRAVRGADLAGVYRDAGMFDVSLREAGRAVSADYANYSAHLFLANSYEQLSDPVWSNLRYESPAGNEFWIANLLAPTSAGWQSAILSQQPYARLFDQNRFGAISETSYLDRGAWLEKADAFYTSGAVSFDVLTSYLYDPGQRPNDDFENREHDVTLKWQVTPRDSVFAQVQLEQIDSGDKSQYYNQSLESTSFQVNERQLPNLFAGYHHEWSPGVHTLLFATRRTADETAYAGNALQYVGYFNGSKYPGVVAFANNEDVSFKGDRYSAELQQIWEQANHATVLGAIYGWGNVGYHNVEWNNNFSGVANNLFPNTPTLLNQDFNLDFHHFSAYGYHHWQLTDTIGLNVGVSYDYLYQPADVATTPFVNQEQTTTQVSPKGGIIWTPLTNTTIRAAYTRSLSGFIDGQSYRLEPTEVAGFNQSFRSLIPESVAGDTSGSQFDTYEISLEQKFDTGTYLGLSGEILHSEQHKLQGAFVFLTSSPLDYSTYPLGLNKSLDYTEQSLTFTADQLLGRQWSAGARYRLSQATLDTTYTDILPANLTNVDPSFHPHQRLESLLHTVNLHANWNHPSGLFSVLEGNWYHQNNSGFLPAEPGDDFYQFNAYVGYRFWQRRAELTIGLLNIFDCGYQLEPLNLYNEMARHRTVLARFLISF